MRKSLWYAHVYMLLSIVVPVIGVLNPVFVYFFGAASIPEAFLYAVGSDRQIGAILCWVWMVVGAAALIGLYILSVFKKKNSFITVFIAADIAVSILFRVLLLCRGMSLDSVLIWGLMCRMVYFLGGFINKKDRRGDE